MNYLIVLFKNKEKRKIINKFKTSKKALKYYDSLLSDSNNVIFETKTENGLGCSFDLALMEIKGSKSEKTYIKDELGRTKVVETDSEDYNIIKINPFRIEEEFWDYSSKTKIDSPFFEKLIKAIHKYHVIKGKLECSIIVPLLKVVRNEQFLHCH
jgi:hypothetical protein